VDATLAPDEISAVVRVRVAELLSGLPLQQLAQNGPAVPVHEGLHQRHAQTGSTPQLHP